MTAACTYHVLGPLRGGRFVGASDYLSRPAVCLSLYVGDDYEIYCGKLYDLLNERALVNCREDGKQVVNIVNLTEVQVDTVDSIMETLEVGMTLRASGQTGANAESSRSHAIMQMLLKHNGRLYSKISFIDLAGSERGADV